MSALDPMLDIARSSKAFSLSLKRGWIEGRLVSLQSERHRLIGVRQLNRKREDASGFAEEKEAPVDFLFSYPFWHCILPLLVTFSVC